MNMPLNGTVWIVRAIFLDKIALILSKSNDNITTIIFLTIYQNGSDMSRFLSLVAVLICLGISISSGVAQPDEGFVIVA